MTKHDLILKLDDLSSARGSVFTKFYKPLLRVTGDIVIASEDGSGVGKVKLDK
jgi:hypothetical protein